MPERADQVLRVAPRPGEWARRRRAKQVRRPEVLASLEPLADPPEVRTDGQPAPLDVPVANSAGDFAANFGEARANPVVRPRRSGGGRQGHGQAGVAGGEAGGGATGLAGGVAAGLSSGMNSSQRV